MINADGSVWVEATDGRLLSIERPYSFCLVAAEGLAEGIVVLEGYYRLGQLVEVSAEDVGCIMHGVARPVQALPPLRRSVERRLELLDAFLGAREAEDALDVRGCICGQIVSV